MKQLRPTPPLPLREKTLIWHLYQAALAGRDIFIDQKHRDALEMRGVIEQIVAHPQGIEPAALAEIRRYTKLFWINTGPYNNLTARKFVLGLTRDELLDAVTAARRYGARFPVANGEPLASFVDRLAPLFFDPAIDALVTSKTPGEGRDILQASSNNLYSGVTMKDLEGFHEQYALNSRVTRRGGQIVEEVYRIGGRYDREIRHIVQHLAA